ncbi:tRNA threonylcarbamoyladenosine dehydratase [bacterium]|nr:tRNA threonylcarbamoyladenosine dehydratase [bacterium]
MREEFQRTEMLLGSESMEKLTSSHVIIYGVGGVGGYVAEALVRSGIGEITIVDFDKVSVSNINRQIIALHSTVGKYKVDVLAERLKDMNPDLIIHPLRTFFSPDNKDEFDFTKYDYVVDAIDTVTGKIEIIKCAKKANVPIISSMGAGNKLDPTKFQVADISKTTVCPLARVIRQKLKEFNIKDVKVVFSTETPVKPVFEVEKENGKNPPASCAFVPSVAGLIIVGEVIKDLIK